MESSRSAQRGALTRNKPIGQGNLYEEGAEVTAAITLLERRRR